MTAARAALDAASPLAARCGQRLKGAQNRGRGARAVGAPGSLAADGLASWLWGEEADEAPAPDCEAWLAEGAAASAAADAAATEAAATIKASSGITRAEAEARLVPGVTPTPTTLLGAEERDQQHRYSAAYIL